MIILYILADLIKYLIWILFFIPALLVELICLITNPIACLFVKHEYRTDRVKRLDNKQVLMIREYPIDLFKYWSTHDNALDEYWYGTFNLDSWFKSIRNWSQHDYDSNWFIRYYCRVAWLMRNNAYGWLYLLFSKPVEPLSSEYQYGTENKSFWIHLKQYKQSFQFELQLPLGGRYLSVNIGWKSHKGFPRKLYANRIISLRSYK